jgi:flagellar hook-basal body complex protein FliE
MSDPVGLINNLGPLNRPLPSVSSRPPAGNAPNFYAVMQEQLQQVNQLQTEANQATVGLMTGQRNDVESVLTATATADNAFRMLQAIRNKVMEAYDEIKQIRV